MASVKTTVLLDEKLLAEAETLAREMQISRSRLFALALRDYVGRHQNRRLLEQINAAYASEPETDQMAGMQRMRKLHRKVVQGEWK